MTKDKEIEIKKLKEEIAVLQAYKDVNESYKESWAELNEKYWKLRRENEAYEQSEQEATEIIAELKQEIESYKDDAIRLELFADKCAELEKENKRLKREAEIKDDYLLMKIKGFVDEIGKVLYCDNASGDKNV